MKTTKTILILTAIFSLALVFSQTAVSAQDNTADLAEEVIIEEPFSQVLEAPVVESSAATEDNSISEEILKVDEPKLLPSSPFYFLKELGRGISNTFTFSSEKKAEKKLEQAAERLAEVKKMLSQTDSGDSNQNKKIVNNLVKYQKDIAKAEASINNVKKDSTAYNDLMDKAVDKYSAFAKVMAADEDLALDIDKDIVKEIYRSKENVLNNLASLVEKLPDPKKLEEVLQNQAGSDFKEFRNLEVLGELESRLPQRAAQAVKQAQEKIKTKIEEKLATSMEGKRGQDFANYVISLKGNQAEHLAILDELAKSSNLSDEVVNNFRKIKDAAAINFSKKMINHPASQEMMEEIASGDIDKLRVLESMADALPDYSAVKEDLEKARQKGIDRAVEKMSQIESTDDKINFLIRDGVPDAKSFVILDQLQAKFNPDQQEQIKAVRNKAFEIFSDIIDKSENKEKLLERLSSDNPKDIETMAAIRENLPVNVAPKFEQLVKNQLEKTEERLVNEENIEKLIGLRTQIDASPQALQLIDSLKPQLIENVNKEQMKKVARAFEQAADPSRVVQIANEYNEILEKYPEVAATIKKVNPGLVKNLIETQTKKIEEGINKISDPEEMQKTLQDLEATGMEKFKNQIGTEAKERITNKIIDRQKTLEKNKFMEQMKQVEGEGEINQQEMERMFEEKVGKMIESSEGRPNVEIKQEMEKVIEEKTETIIREKMEQQLNQTPSGQQPEQMPGVQSRPSTGEIEKTMQEQIQQIIPKIISPEQDQSQQMPSGEIDRQQQLQQIIPKIISPEQDQSQQMPSRQIPR